jgi:phospholipase C
LKEEYKQLCDILKAEECAKLCEVVERPFATSKQIWDVFQDKKYRDRIVIFHYAGHAEDFRLLLESSSGEVSPLHAPGFAAFLGEQHGLRLVFLNACSTLPQVQGLLDANVPAVIATSEKIAEQIAIELAARFYKGLAGGISIRRAYNEAVASIRADFGDDILEYYLDGAPTEARWPWELYPKVGGAAHEWSLPEAAGVAWVVLFFCWRERLEYPKEVIMSAENLDKLDKIEHIVVLMLENRSFDHMLGFLSLPASKGGRGRSDIEGLKDTDEYRKKFRNEYQGKIYAQHPLANDYLHFQWDPCHEFECVQKQLDNHNGGFVENFAAKHHQIVKDVELKDPGLIMGYYTASQLPVFDKLAQQFCVCDRWFSSLPGPTIPNRLYAVAGTSDGKTESPSLVPLPKYEVKTVFDCLAERGTSWRYYCHDVAMLWFFEKYARMRLKRMVSFTDDPVDNIKKFYELAKEGDLPAVSWIDPDFATVIGYSHDGNDDHPPSNVQNGQNLVRTIYNALLKSPRWDKTLFVMTYDEHGGFYDHVEPPVAEDDFPHLRRYGLRVPGLVISPWVGKQTASHEIFDHTSIVKTILLRFCRENGGIPHLSKRVDNATPLSVLLTEAKPRRDCKEVPVYRSGRITRKFEAEETDLQKLMKALHNEVNPNQAP